ncbi:tRNA-uridine aminocarboxypropyltransferase [Marinomonas sp. GJ51-6]|nr:tRNA-uridine aminocarboxypropyltransferase [Marinomonas sp. GJ51-6]WOD07480.1 tRNA-uridine aminocarboxypropyltransferase [Marinomonas sp. GJ51-6]
MVPNPKPHCVDILREQCKQESMRPFQARGSNLVRCPYCLMSKDACFCHLRNTGVSPVEFILLFHRDEIHKPTNSGRLIADLFPEDTKAYIWSRTEPSTPLLEHLSKVQGNCTVLFPNTDTAKAQERELRSVTPSSSAIQKHTFIILDGTWKQASKMFHQSEWLKHIPHFEVSSEAKRSFLVRHSSHKMQFATAEVTAMLLDTLGHLEQSQQLLHYYQAFNKRCLDSRRRYEAP